MPGLESKTAGASDATMTKPIPNSDWLSFMYAIQHHVRRKLAEGMVVDLQNRLREQSAEGLLALAEPEIVRAIKLLVPGLSSTFLWKIRLSSMPTRSIYG
jgi:hypothetical protein